MKKLGGSQLNKARNIFGYIRDDKDKAILEKIRNLSLLSYSAERKITPSNTRGFNRFTTLASLSIASVLGSVAVDQNYEISVFIQKFIAVFSVLIIFYYLASFFISKCSGSNKNNQKILYYVVTFSNILLISMGLFLIVNVIPFSRYLEYLDEYLIRLEFYLPFSISLVDISDLIYASLAPFVILIAIAVGDRGKYFLIQNNKQLNRSTQFAFHNWKVKILRNFMYYQIFCTAFSYVLMFRLDALAENVRFIPLFAEKAFEILK